MLPSWLCFAYLSLSGPKGVWRLGILVWLLPQPCMFFLPQALGFYFFYTPTAVR